MKTIRVIAFGFLLAALLMISFGPTAIRWWASSTELNALILAIDALSPHQSATMGLGLIAPIIFLLVSLSVGLLVSTVGYPPLETAVRAAILAVTPRLMVPPPARPQAASRMDSVRSETQ